MLGFVMHCFTLVLLIHHPAQCQNTVKADNYVIYCVTLILFVDHYKLLFYWLLLFCRREDGNEHIQNCCLDYAV